MANIDFARTPRVYLDRAIGQAKAAATYARDLVPAEVSEGAAKRIEGPYEEGECICLIEDVVTSGGALLDSVEALRAAGLVVHTAVCVVDREEGGADALARQAVRLRPLFGAAEPLGTKKSPANRMVEP